MKKGISKRARTEVIAVMHQRYQAATKREKTRILDEFVAVTQCHRKHAVRLLGEGDGAPVPSVQVAGRRGYNEAVREALILAWEAADRICGKRLKAILPSLVDAMEHHGHLNLDPRVREGVLAVERGDDRSVARAGTKPGRSAPAPKGRQEDQSPDPHPDLCGLGSTATGLP